jgi:hypothetical protein
MVMRIGVLMALMYSGLASAQGPIDTDGDGAVSLAEWQAVREQAAARRFAALDADGDGLLTPEEMRAARARGREALSARRERVEAIDTDGDGAWSLPELQAVRPEIDAERFNRLDTNGNGLIDADERPMRRGGLRGIGPRAL